MWPTNAAAKTLEPSPAFPQGACAVLRASTTFWCGCFGLVVLARRANHRRLLHLGPPSGVHRTRAMMPKAAIALWGGPIGFVAALLLLPTGGEVNGAALAGTAWWMLWWWLGGAVSMGATSLLPLVLFPTFGVLELSASAAPFRLAVSSGYFSGDLCWPWPSSDTVCTAGLPCVFSEPWAVARGGPFLVLCSPRRC